MPTKIFPIRVFQVLIKNLKEFFISTSSLGDMTFQIMTLGVQ